MASSGEKRQGNSQCNFHLLCWEGYKGKFSHLLCKIEISSKFLEKTNKNSMKKSVEKEV
jgi:hypothetical protein